MDPLSQGSLGAALAQSGSNRDTIKKAVLFGCFGGLAPDLDILIFSTTDPLLFLEFHRQFTHSLLFIPFGALIVAAATHWLFGKGLRFKQTYLFCLLGYATHGLLDACTTYGTQLLWPITNERYAWNNVSIIDPLFTLPILALVITGVFRKEPWFGRVAVIWAVTYLSFGLLQRDRAEAAGYELARERGHEPLKLEAKPGFANLLLWKTVYETETNYHVDAIRVGFDTVVFPGGKATKLNLDKHFLWLDPESQQAIDIERFRWFSNNYLGLDPNEPNRIIDVRYSVVPNEINALWGIDIQPDQPKDAHVIWVASRQTSPEQTEKLWRMLTE
ncbi:MAG: inner membrane protein [Candidatus Azotimanducaceae bacterium]|jgi:inner membrane protein